MSDQRCDPDVWHANGLPATDCATCFPPGSRNPYAAPGIGIPPPEPWPEDDAPGHPLMAAETQTPCPECGYHPDMVRNALRAGTRCKTCGRFWEGAPTTYDRNGQWLTKTPEEWVEFLRMFNPKDLTPARCVNLQDHLRSITSLEDEVIRITSRISRRLRRCFRFLAKSQVWRDSDSAG